ncbi:4-alpha-glucanotransferase [Bradyrhizobium sp. AUGA SZCCT0283]|jgi:4-alpha-glucanotransferase|uniref:4-alpha-glucanotransferase n=1 Tax=Bradyrhizobium sp. AUGA SZCCT0283 TaxID=2807671 RepID=UPI001BA7780F|nr:4-alpha-glucanotransferase [Bradyrhizobium sp. AUGA SZCCT0283]MBR1277072.1 4-alpha-glucanotransferase [Bradyrhizobium sp. AUGA SZCCT0283]
MDLFAQAKAQGIQTEFLDGQGHRRVTDAAALKIILDALPPQAPGPLVGRPVVVRSGRPSRTELPATAGLPVEWKIVADSGLIAKGESSDHAIDWPRELPLGIYRLQVSDATTAEDVPLISAPERAFGGEFDRCWLLAVQLYGVRSARNWGMGDFTDLASLIEFADHLGADGIGLNPLHALFDDRPGDCSPYSPNSRLFLNALYIDVEKVSEFQPDSETREALAPLRAGDVVDYFGVAGLKWRALRKAFAAFKASAKPGRQQDFDKFRAERGTLLSHFACFEVLRHKFGKPWWEWPQEWRQPDDARCAALRQGEHADEIEFVEFVQWTADRQLGAAADLAKQLGMKVGLYLDVAVGVQADGFDAWNEQVAISRHLGVGAPPDPLNTAGQTWGLAGFNAVGLELESFAPYRDMLRASMRHAGAIRLDHVLGLKRLYLVPQGFSARDGVYVQMPFEALLAVTAQESVANRCVVIGEDLGTVPEGFRDQIADWGIWSYLVMMFERDDAGSFRHIDHYLTNALVTFNTHDLSTYAGWRSFGDLKLKRSLGIDPGESDDARWHALAMLDDVLRHHTIDRNDLYSVANFLARTKSRLLAISLEDLLGVMDQPNIPGTVNEHPNWRQRLPVPIEEMTSTVDVAALKAATHERSRAAI